MKTSTVIKHAYHLIKNPKRWSKGDFAINEAGTPCLPKDLQAVCWCASGALHRAGGNEGTERAARMMRSFLGGRGVAYFNDFPKTTHADVLALFRKAYKVARRAEHRAEKEGVR